MKPIPSARWIRLAALLLAGWRAGYCDAPAADNSSLTDRDIEYDEAQVALQSSERQNAALRQQLDAAQKQLALARQQISALTDSLAIAASESEIFKRGTADLKMRLEALGLDSASPDRAPLEQRLLKAVGDLKIVQDQKDKIAEQLIRLDEAILRYIKTASSVDGDARMGLETEMRSSNDLLGGAAAGQPAQDTDPAGSLMDARVISVKEELALVVANLGRLQGARIGMPFQVWHDGRKIGIVRVVDVREKISGAIIQTIDPSAKIQVGDTLRVDARM